MGTGPKGFFGGTWNWELRAPVPECSALNNRYYPNNRKCKAERIEGRRGRGWEFGTRNWRTVAEHADRSNLPKRRGYLVTGDREHGI